MPGVRNEWWDEHRVAGWSDFGDYGKSVRVGERASCIIGWVKSEGRSGCRRWRPWVGGSSAGGWPKVGDDVWPGRWFCVGRCARGGGPMKYGRWISKAGIAR